MATIIMIMIRETQLCVSVVNALLLNIFYSYAEYLIAALFP